MAKVPSRSFDARQIVSSWWSCREMIRTLWGNRPPRSGRARTAAAGPCRQILRHQRLPAPGRPHNERHFAYREASRPEPLDRLGRQLIQPSISDLSSLAPSGVLEAKAQSSLQFGEPIRFDRFHCGQSPLKSVFYVLVDNIHRYTIPVNAKIPTFSKKYSVARPPNQ